MESGSSQVRRLSSSTVLVSSKSAITQRKLPLLPAACTRVDHLSHTNYAVADRFGRMFLRVCLWADVAVTFSRRNRATPIFRARTCSATAPLSKVANSTAAISPRIISQASVEAQSLPKF